MKPSTPTPRPPAPNSTVGPQPARRQRGATLVECAATLLVIGVLCGLAAPSFEAARERRHLEGIASQLETDLQFARSEAVARGASVRVNFETLPDGASCYVVHDGGAGDCRCDANGVAACPAGAEALRTVVLGAGLPVRLSSNSRSILFDAVKGTVTPTATLRVRVDGGAAVHHVVNVMGRIRSCSPAPALPGYRTC